MSSTAKFSALLIAASLAVGSYTPGKVQAAAQSPVAVTQADLGNEKVAPAVQQIADWALRSLDHRDLPFIIVDKVNAKAYAFDRRGRLIKSTAILIGMGTGDAFPPGVVNMDMYQTQPWQRITPAGRFVAEEGKNLAGETVLWLDYDNGIALHKLPSRRTKQRRQERIASANPAEHRITYGCINVPAAFYDAVVLPQFRRKGGLVYVLPDSTPLKSVFRSFDGIERRGIVQHTARQMSAAQSQSF